MTRPLAITANTPIASNTFVHTPVHTKSLSDVYTLLEVLLNVDRCVRTRLVIFKKPCATVTSGWQKPPPMSLVFLGTIRRSSRTILMASRRISKMLLTSASRGARGKAATKMVVKLNCITGNAREPHGHFICYSQFKMPTCHREPW